MVAEVSTVAPAAALHAVVADLGTYPEWLDIVAAADPLGQSDDAAPAWSVVLQARVGPLRRSKRLRMVRTIDSPSELCFERRELDGRSHSAWRLHATIEEIDAASGSDGAGSRLTMRLHYGGSLWIPVLDRLLTEEIRRSRTRLIELLAR